MRGSRPAVTDQPQRAPGAQAGACDRRRQDEGEREDRAPACYHPAAVSSVRSYHGASGNAMGRTAGSVAPAVR